MGALEVARAVASAMPHFRHSECSERSKKISRGFPRVKLMGAARCGASRREMKGSLPLLLCHSSACARSEPAEEWERKVRMTRE
jgi:hypothetical protein